ncbi:MAG TPA: CapA family protein [Clostridia bacterium]|nr:CapA family protein [Clostridia bacterium]
MRKIIALLAALLLCLTPAMAEEDAELNAIPIKVEFEYVAGETPEQQAEQTDGVPRASLIVEDGWPRTIVVTAGGDCTIGCTNNQRARKDGFANVVAKKGYAWPFSGLVELFSGDDLTLVNFEGTLTESTDAVEKLFNFKGPKEYAQILTLGSVEAVNLANNHFHDYGDQGKLDTMAALDAENIVYCGEGKTAIYETRGVKIGLIGNTFPYKSGQRDISAEVRELRSQGCQIVIASFHWGSEYEADFSRDQRNIGRAAIDAGADVVIGHHPHVLQGIEYYNGHYIFYSMGNLVFGGNTDPSDRDSFLAQLSFEVHEDSTLAPTLSILPIRLTEQSSGTDYRPVLAQGETAQRILNRILKKSVNMPKE